MYRYKIAHQVIHVVPSYPGVLLNIVFFSLGMLRYVV